ncbi:class I SAM-dependent methyltransferase [Planomonospora corallina]|uniref:Class I SAM-dependent methyltransferase n=1 Tax=Planomonospora corallina TaxID=1806052 RepID=A0ABV8IEC7_9ACTN
MLDYDAEAARYDATRGGVPRAEAAARAVLELLPPEAETLLDLGCGTGLVTSHITRPGLRVLGLDASPGMARLARDRLEHRVLLGDGRALPFADASLDAVCSVWLFHLIPGVPEAIAECARVLRPGGVLITTVDKDAAHGHDDVGRVLAPYRRHPARDRAGLVVACGGRHGLRLAAETVFTGHGQGRSPLRAVELVEAGYLAVGAADVGALKERLAALPDPSVPRPDPVYRLVCLRRA